MDRTFNRRCTIILLLCSTTLICGKPIFERYHGYHDNHELTNVLKEFAEKFPQQTHLYSIGKSVEGKDLWVIALANQHADIHVKMRPEIAYIANMHGDETVGRELLIYLVDYLLNEKNDKNVENILTRSRVHVMPSMNPDGFQLATEGTCSNGKNGRNNAKDVDLNRNFPDFLSNNKDDRIAERESETVAVMQWMDTAPFVLATNFHGGILVANYPYDSNKEQIAKYSKAPDDDILKHLSLVYANNHDYMSSGCLTQESSLDKFRNGITNGANWYSVRGSLQDYQYVFKGIMATTMEVSCCKYPTASEDVLRNFWLSNKKPMLELLKQANKGVRGYVVDKNGENVMANMQIIGRPITFTSTEDGEYYRILLPGNYTLKVQADNYGTTLVKFVIPSDQELLELNITMNDKGDNDVMFEENLHTTDSPTVDKNVDEKDEKVDKATVDLETNFVKRELPQSPLTNGREILKNQWSEFSLILILFITNFWL